jgi:hypothetical protein
MALQQASSTVRNVDVAMRRHIDGPSRVDRLSKNFIDHPPTPVSVTTDGNSHYPRKFPIFLETFRGQREWISPSCNLSELRSRGLESTENLKAFQPGQLLGPFGLIATGKSGNA